MTMRPEGGEKRGGARARGHEVIRVRKDGFLYEYNDYLARNVSCEVVTVAQALQDLKAQGEEVPEWLQSEEDGRKESEEAKQKRVSKAESDANEGSDENARRRNHALEADASRKLPK